MMIWVVTGPVGAGKSSVTSILAQRGAAVVDADRLGHEVLADPAIVETIAREFGPECVLEEGQVNRARLGSLVFGNEQALKRLNDLTHGPLIALAQQRLEDLSKQRQHKLAVLEAAVYFLWPAMDLVDLVVAVVSRDDIRRHRLMNDRGLTSEQVAQRFQSQAAMDSLWSGAQVILENNEDLRSLEKSVDDLLKKNNL